MNFAKGYKTYAIAAVAAIIGVDQGLIAAHVAGVPAIPGWVLFFLTAAGLYTARSGTTADVAKATTDIASQIVIPPAVAPVTVNVTNSGTQSDDPAFNSGAKMAGKL